MGVTSCVELSETRVRVEMDGDEAWRMITANQGGAHGDGLLNTELVAAAFAQIDTDGDGAVSQVKSG